MNDEPKLTVPGIKMARLLAEGVITQGHRRYTRTIDGIRANLRLCSRGRTLSGGAVLSLRLPIGVVAYSYSSCRVVVSVRLPKGWTQDTLERACSRAIHRFLVLSGLEELRERLYNRVEASGIPFDTLEALAAEMSDLGITSLFSGMSHADVAAWHQVLDEVG